MYQIIKRVKFINEDSIPVEIFNKAFLLTNDIDEKDTIFIAMADFLDCKLWSGDLKLMNGLRKKEYINILKTDELIKNLTL
jgi:predicted nucleic acid-binding protein